MKGLLADVDPFDLPEWLGAGDVTWYADSGLRTGHHIAGSLLADGQASLPCDLLAVDEAYPAPVADDAMRLHAHQAWRHDQVLLASYAADAATRGRLVLLVPGAAFTADLVLDALGRLAKAVGASPDHYAAHLRIGD
ncbi:MAG: hypothetical protein WKF79_13685 [Nocardioides sp.]